MKNRNTVISEIEYDITNGIYDNFPRMKNRLVYIVAKMRIINALLSRTDFQILAENEYIDKSQTEFKY
jgi:hypothetical protein